MGARQKTLVTPDQDTLNKLIGVQITGMLDICTMKLEMTLNKKIFTANNAAHYNWTYPSQVPVKITPNNENFVHKYMGLKIVHWKSC